MFIPRKKQKSSASMRKLMLMMMVGLTTVTIFVFVVLIVLTRLLPSLDDAGYRLLYNQTTAAASQLAADFETVSRSVWRANANLEEKLNGLLRDNRIDFEQLSSHGDAVDNYISSAYGVLAELLDEQVVSGAFFVLETEYDLAQQNSQVSLYLRNTMAASTASASASITLLQGPVRIPELQGLALDKNWSYGYLRGEGGRAMLYEKPAGAAREYPKASERDLGYWNTRFRLYASDSEIITYTVPMIGENGDIYGVCGIEISLTNLSRITPSGDLPFTEGFYLFGLFNDAMLDSDTMVSNDLYGSIFLRDVEGVLTTRRVSDSNDYNVYAFKDGQNQDLLAGVRSVDLYTRNSPFLEEGYSLLAIAPRSQVLEQSATMTRDIWLMLLFSAILSIAGAFVLSRYFALRIEKLATEAGQMNPEKPVSLPRTKIHELDLLTDVLERMNADVAAHAARMSTIVDSVGMPMGAFEINLSQNRVFLTDSLFRLLGVAHSEEDSQYMPIELFRTLLPQVDFSMDEDSALDFLWRDPYTKEASVERWFRLRRTSIEDFVYGTVLDITEEVKNKKRLEYERNYDPLTKLLNRNAYGDLMEDQILTKPGKKGVFMFGDLDNLKSVNDTFGHDVGDRYILQAAEALSELSKEGGIVARISGDEFAAYLHGADDRQELRKKMDRFLEHVRSKQMVMPDGAVQKVRISVGLAYYPDDAENIPDLMRYADFAMYEIKHSAKGGTQEFNKESYDRNSYILKKPGQLDFLLDHRRTKFAFQPIVNVQSGEIFAYEALMRPQTREIHSPGQVISLARSQAKLPQLEQMTIDSLMDWIRENYEDLGRVNLFFNSLPNQLLEEEQYEIIRKTIQEYNCNIVMEITEEEQTEPGIMAQKVAMARKMNMKIALDDFGSGYSNFINLLNIRPDYIKIDMSLVHNIDKDASRQTLFRSIIEYAKIHDMGTIAEGVETWEELRMVVDLGVNFVQGFYVCHPEYRLIKQVPEKIVKELKDILL